MIAVTFDAYGLASDTLYFGKIKRLPCEMVSNAAGDMFVRFDAKERCFIRRIQNTNIGIAFGNWDDRETLTYSPENSVLEIS